MISNALTTPGPYSYLLMKAFLSLSLETSKSFPLESKIDNYDL